MALQRLLIPSMQAAAPGRQPVEGEGRNDLVSAFTSISKEIRLFGETNQVWVWSKDTKRVVPLATRIGATSIVLESEDGTRRLSIETNDRLGAIAFQISGPGRENVPVTVDDPHLAAEEFVRRMGEFVVTNRFVKRSEADAARTGAEVG